MADLPPLQQGPFAGVIRDIDRCKLLLRVKEDFFIFLQRQLGGMPYQDLWVRVHPTRRPKHVRRESQNLATLTIRFRDFVALNHATNILRLLAIMLSQDIMTLSYWGVYIHQFQKDRVSLVLDTGAQQVSNTSNTSL